MDRITQRKCADWGWLYASSPEKAESLANGQDHNYALMLCGPIDARDGIQNEKTVGALCAEIATASAKLQMDTCLFPRNRESPCMKNLNCVCDNISLNPPIIFETTYFAKDHLLNGMAVYGVLLTGKKKEKSLKLIC